MAGLSKEDQAAVLKSHFECEMAVMVNKMQSIITELKGWIKDKDELITAKNKLIAKVTKEVQDLRFFRAQALAESIGRNKQKRGNAVTPVLIASLEDIEVYQRRIKVLNSTIISQAFVIKRKDEAIDEIGRKLQDVMELKKEVK